jgi:hypothetical protein
MKRRTFLFLTASGAVAMGIPWVSCNSRGNSRIRALANPEFLSHICDEATIKAIGTVYRAQTTTETQQDKLIELLRTSKNPAKDIQEDYSSGRIVIIRGWVLSLTEARQCALYSLSM